MKTEIKKTWIGIFFLIATEEFIKIIINNNYFDKRFAILPPFLYFEPMFNRRYSWFNSMLQLGDGKWLHIVVVSVIIILIYLFYHYLNKALGNSNMINIMFAFIFSGAVCSLIDKIFWNGSLDYILVSGLFTFDLKDVYLNVFNGLLILSLLFKSKFIQQIDEKNVFEDFIKFIAKRNR